MKRIVIVAVSVLSLIVGLAAAGVFWLRSDGGRAWIVREIASRASTPGDLEVSIGGLAGDPFGAFRITDIQVRDRDGEWLAITSADVEWRPLDLLHGVLAFTRVDIRDAALRRLPQSDPSAPAVSLAERVEAFRNMRLLRIAAMTVGDLALGAPVLGEAAALRIAGSIETGAGSAVRGGVTVTRVDGHAGSIDAKGTYAAADDSLALDISVMEPAGGLIARILNIPGLPPLQATVAGTGSLADWRGRIDLSFERVAAAKADVTIRRKTETEFAVTGTATVPTGKATLLRQLVSGDHKFRAHGAYSSGQDLTLSDVQWTTPAAELTASGRLHLDDLTIDGKGSVRKAGTGPLVLKPTDASLASLAVDVTVSGRLPMPLVQLSYEVGRFNLPDVAIADIAGTTTVTPDGADRGLLDGTSTLRSIVWANRSALTVLAGEEATLVLGGRFDLARTALRIESARGAFSHAEITGSGDFQWAEGDGAVQATLALPDLSVLRDTVALPLTGRIALSVDTTLHDFGAEAAASLNGSGADLSTGNQRIDSILGREATVMAALLIVGKKIDAKKVTINSGRANLQADATYDLARDAITGRYEVGIDAGPPLPLADAVAAECPCRLGGQIKGSLANPGSVGDLALQSLRLRDFSLRAPSMHFDLANLLGKPGGAVTVRTETPLGALTARAVATLQADRLRLADIRVDASDAVVQGTLDIPLSGDPVGGNLTVEAGDLRALFAAARFDGEGAAKGTVTLRADRGRQAVHATAEVAKLRFRQAPDAPVVAVAKATIGIAADDVAAGDRNRIDLRLDTAAIGDVTLESATVSARGSPSKATLSLSAKGEWHGPLALDGAALYAVADGGQSLAVSKLQGSVLGEKVSLATPLRLSWSGAEYAAEPVNLAFGGAKLTGHARVGRKAADVSLALAGLPLATVDPFWLLEMKGKIDGSLSFKGSWPHPDGLFSISIPSLQVDPAPEAPALAVDINGDWRRGRLTLKGKLAASDAAPSVFNASLPLRIDGPDLFVTLPRDQPITGDLSWSGETSALWRFAPLPEHLIRGAGTVDVTLSGTMAKPVLRGTLALTDGYYESLEFGTVLKPLDLAIGFDGSGARITRLSAGDGGTGSVNGMGNISLDPDRGFPFDLSLTLKELTAVRRDDVQASASGEVSVTGSIKKMKVASKLTTGTVDIRIPDRLPPEVVTLDVVEKGRFGDTRSTGRAEKQTSTDIGLAIDVEMPRRVFVRGRGIDSEWKGNLKVTGAAGDPRIAGYLALVRGQLTVVGKTFRMESGNVVLPDRINAEPELSLNATYTGRSLTVQAQVDGPVSKPSITLSSVPSLPQDEIVSNVLFDKSSSKLSPFEAAQLGFALAELAGKGGGGGVLDFARKTLGVDVLQIESVETAKGSQPVVGAGKYLADGVYVGVKQGATPQSSSIGIEVEVTPHIFLDSDTRRDGQSDVGVKFKLDY